MESESKKLTVHKKADCSILVIDNDQIVITRIKTLLSKNKSARYDITESCSVSDIKKKIISQSVDLIFYGLKSGSTLNRRICDVLIHPKTPPIVRLYDSKSFNRFSNDIFHVALDKRMLTKGVLEEVVHNNLRSIDCMRSIDECIKDQSTREFRFLEVILNSPDGIIIVKNTNKIQFINPAAVELLTGERNGKPLELLPFTIKKKPVQEVVLSKLDRVLEIRISTMSWNSSPVSILSIRDITIRKKAEVSLQISEKRYALAIKCARERVWEWELKSDVFSICDSQSPIGDTFEKMTSSEWFSRVHPTDIRKLRLRLKSHINGKSDNVDFEFRMLNESKEWNWVHIRGKISKNKRGEVVSVTGLQSDITERKKAERQLKKSLDDLSFALASEKVLMDELDKKNKELIELSITDGLTGLYNHRFLQERFDFEYKRVKRYGGCLSCMMIDIDHFKLINDTYGHQFGDLVLRQLSDLLKENSREVDICGRYGGEEFMLITNLQAEDTFRFASKLHTIIEKHLFECGQKKIHVTVSIGISEFHSDIKSKQQLIERADTALYQAKTEGRNQIRVWKKIESVDDYMFDMSSTNIIRSKFMDLSLQMRMTYIESTNALVKAVDAKDPFAKEHSHNVSMYSVLIAEAMGLCANDVEIIRYAALLHDVGKISVKDEILTKKSALDPDEYNILKRHPEVGVNILKDLKFLEKEIPIILHHHERYDGKGYPHGLKAKEIPVGARIVAVADAIDAMTSGRTYKKKLGWREAIAEIELGSGKQFAPDIVEIVVALYNKGKFGK